nr:hypothetical protein [Gloeotrichia echinulata DEX184]
MLVAVVSSSSSFSWVLAWRFANSTNADSRVIIWSWAMFCLLDNSACWIATRSKIASMRSKRESALVMIPPWMRSLYPEA